MASDGPSGTQERYGLQASYGKQSVPVLKVRKTSLVHEVIDMMVDITLQGDVADSWLSGDNHQIVPTETQKNTCYAVAMNTDFDSVEEYAIALAADMIVRHGHLDVVTVRVVQRSWDRIAVGGKQHNHAFQSAKDSIKRTCAVRQVRGQKPLVTSGIEDLKLMKTTQSGFAGFIRDKYTNLEPVQPGTKNSDRIMCTELTCNWTYNRPPGTSFRASNDDIIARLCDIWSGEPVKGHYSKSVQETTYKMALNVLDHHPELEAVELLAPNVHHYRYPLEQFGIANANIVFQSTDCHTTASGRIETRVARPKASL